MKIRLIILLPGFSGIRSPACPDTDTDRPAAQMLPAAAPGPHRSSVPIPSRFTSSRTINLPEQPEFYFHCLPPCLQLSSDLLTVK